MLIFMSAASEYLFGNSAGIKRVCMPDNLQNCVEIHTFICLVAKAHLL